MKLYPVFLNLVDVPVVVIGGGKVAARKVRSLQLAQAQILIISPQLTPPINRLVQLEKVQWKCRKYRKRDLRMARIVIAATDDLEMNQRICNDAQQLGLLVNCAAPSDIGNFQVPSIVRHGDMTIAISTGGASPALAKQLRQELECLLRDGYADIAKRMRAMRKKANKSSISFQQRKTLYEKTLNGLMANPRKRL